MTTSLLFCSILLNAHGKRKRSRDRCTKRHSRCTKRHSRQGRASKAPRISYDSKQLVSHQNITRELSSCGSEECDLTDWKPEVEEPLSQQRISDESKQLFGDQNIARELSSCGPEECDLTTDCKPEVEEPLSKQAKGTSDEIKTAMDFIRKMFTYRPERWELTDSEQEVEEKSEEPDSKTRVWERFRPGWANSDVIYEEDDVTEPEREKYGIALKVSRTEKNVLCLPPNFAERSAAALLDASRFLEECLKPTTSCCFEEEPYNLFVESYSTFECDLSEAEVQLVKKHEDLYSIWQFMEDCF